MMPSPELLRAEIDYRFQRRPVWRRVTRAGGWRWLRIFSRRGRGGNPRSKEAS